MNAPTPQGATAPVVDPDRLPAEVRASIQAQAPAFELEPPEPDKAPDKDHIQTMLDRGWKKSAVAREISVHPAQISRVLKGEQSLSSEPRRRLLELVTAGSAPNDPPVPDTSVEPIRCAATMDLFESAESPIGDPAPFDLAEAIAQGAEITARAGELEADSDLQTDLERLAEYEHQHQPVELACFSPDEGKTADAPLAEVQAPESIRDRLGEEPARFPIALADTVTGPITRRREVTWSELAKRLKSVEVGAKDGPLWLAGDHAPGPRGNEHVRSVSVLALDVEAKTARNPETGIKTVIGPEPPTLQEMAAEIELCGWRAILHTTHSHLDPGIQPPGVAHHRYRLVLALDRPLQPGELDVFGRHVASVLGISDCFDPSTLKPSQPLYLPRAPQERLIYFGHVAIEGDPLPVESLLNAARAAQDALRAAAGKRQGPQTASVIDTFNAAHDVRELLRHHGYIPKRGNRWMHPESTTGMAGVRLLPESDPPRVFSSHGCCPLNDGHAHDAFSVWCILAHGGDTKAAVREAARLLGVEGERHTRQTTGERGEKGENPSGARAGAEVNRGERGAKRGESRANLTDDQKRAALSRAARLLVSEVSPMVEYPIDALGPLAEPTRALADGVQIREAMAGQSLLAVAAMLAQSVANVRTIESVKPVSLYLLTIGESGDGKSSGDAVAQSAIQARQRAEAREYLEQVRDAQAKGKSRTKDEDPEELPPEPYRIARDGTVEGIRRSFAQGVPSQGVFSSEAAAMLSGYGMNADNRAKTAATFNALWDDGELSVSRGTTGRLQLYDRRLSIHWLLQPEAAHEVMSDPLLSGIGFWPRFLIAWPEPSAPRVARPWRADQCPEIGAFWRACTRLLDRPMGDDCSDLPVLDLTDEAMQLACGYFERLEQAAKGKPAPLREIKPYAVRSTEQALRVAGVLSVFEGLDRVDAAAMRNGIALAAYALETWRGVFGDRDVRTARQLALTLYRWLLEQPEASASLTAISRIGPKATRPKDRRDTALAVLEHAGLVTSAGYTWSVEVPE
ncbi:DUF3987 domain-containing protein [Allochromatium vinosum]|uniref:DUF3987 domain-containing protein n=1 Tax=Allochromatium vinosum (strain ATCC 17899 / DSM 180 / NBRC 103801 / NCIMB 10441 / D) TaxID=572477 RepID=D3RTX5_ALLVD|nr:DUF3987 domain-containing protein [Allochromatium vinosum]ADC62634.1 hypothetical protein Alvin_1702 [Allochromatium vinosum DSM 180]